MPYCFNQTTACWLKVFFSNFWAFKFYFNIQCHLLSRISWVGGMPVFFKQLGLHQPWNQFHGDSCTWFEKRVKKSGIIEDKRYKAEKLEKYKNKNRVGNITFFITIDWSFTSVELAETIPMFSKMRNELCCRNKRDIREWSQTMHLDQAPSLWGEDPIQAIWSRKSKADFEEECSFSSSFARSQVAPSMARHVMAVPASNADIPITRAELQQTLSVDARDLTTIFRRPWCLSCSPRLQKLKDSKFILSRRFMVIEKNGSCCNHPALA